MSGSALLSKSYWQESAGKDPAGQDVSRGYLLYLMIFATGGWAMAAYDFNLQVMSLSNIAHALGLSSTQVGLFGFFVNFAEFVFTLFFGRPVRSFATSTGNSAWFAHWPPASPIPDWRFP